MSQFQSIVNQIDDHNRLWLYMDFLKPGVNTYVIREPLNQKYFTH